MKKEAQIFQKLKDKLKSFFSTPIDETEESEQDLAIERHDEVDVDDGVVLEESPIENEVLIQDIDVEKGEVESYEYRADVPPDLQARLGDPKVDHSYTALMYLYSLGYSQVDFMLNPAEDREYDICDELVNQNPWTLEGILANAGDDSLVEGYPIAPIFWMSHPGCLCYLHVHAPDTPDDIPDNAPGLHMWADEENIQKEKEELWNTLPTIVEVDSMTMGPEVFTRVKEMYASERWQNWFYNHGSTKKIAKGWVEEIKPVRIKENIFVKQPLGLVQVINKDAKGFQLETFNEIARVFLYEFGRDIFIPVDNLDILSLTLSSKTEPDDGDFVVSDEEYIAIAYGMIDGELLVYDPDYNNLVRVDDWQVLEIV